VPTAYTTPYTDADACADLLSQQGVDFRIDDDGDTIIVAGETTKLTNAINWATARVNASLLERFDAADLAADWNVLDYATVLACWRLCRRRLNPNPLQAEFERVDGELKEIRAGERALAEVGERTALLPGFTALRLDGRYPTRQLRVERKISDPVPTPTRRQDVDRVAEIVPDLP
jgi:hypothetical protein